MYDPKETNSTVAWPACAYSAAPGAADIAEACAQGVASAAAAAAWASVHAAERPDAARETRRVISGIFDRIRTWFAGRGSAAAARGFELQPVARVRHDAVRAEALRCWIALF